MMRPVFLDFPEVFAPTRRLRTSRHRISSRPQPADRSTSVRRNPRRLLRLLPESPRVVRLLDWTRKRPLPRRPPSTASRRCPVLGAEVTYPRAIHPPLDTMPVYVRDGSIMPLQPLIQNTDETPRVPLELHVYPGSQCSGSHLSRRRPHLPLPERRVPAADLHLRIQRQGDSCDFPRARRLLRSLVEVCRGGDLRLAVRACRGKVFQQHVSVEDDLRPEAARPAHDAGRCVGRGRTHGARQIHSLISSSEAPANLSAT